jgi:triosephosphate isomerase
MRKILVAGNWKMNKDKNETHIFTQALANNLRNQFMGMCEVVIAPPFPFLALAQENTAHAPIHISAQNVSEHESGAYTGEVSAPMLQSLQVDYCIVVTPKEELIMVKLII